MEDIRYVSFEMGDVEDPAIGDDDAAVRYFIDGYPADEDMPGTVIAEVILTKRGDITVSWHHNGYRLEPAVLELIDQAKEELANAGVR